MLALEKFKNFRKQLLEIAINAQSKVKCTWWYKKSEAEITNLIENIWAFGPSKAQANILFNALEDYQRPSIWSGKKKEYLINYFLDFSATKLRALDRAIVAGFDSAMSQGPLCDEPVQGVGIILEEWSILEEDGVNTFDSRPADPQLQGQLISVIRQTCKAALKKHPLRLVAAMYRCLVQTSTQALGKVQMVLSQRQAKVN